MKIDDLEDRILESPLFGFSSALLLFTILSYALFGNECIVIDFRQKDNIKIYQKSFGENFFEEREKYQSPLMEYDSTFNSLKKEK